MRLSGHRAAIQYLVHHLDDCDDDVDLDIAIWIGDGYLEFDPVTEIIYQTPAGKIYFHSGTMH